MDDKLNKMQLGLLRKDLKLYPSYETSSSENSWILFDPTNDNYFKIYEEDYNIIAGLTKNHTLESYFDYLSQVLKLNVTKQDILDVVSFLRANGLMLPDYRRDETVIKNQRDIKKKTFFLRLFMNLLFLKIPVWRPDKFLTKTMPYLRIFFNKWVLYLLLFISLTGYVLIIVNWNRFVIAFIESLNFKSLLNYWFVIVVIKVIHEFAHCYSAKYFGVRIRCLGFGLVFFLPRFYSDITDAWRIPDGTKRAIVDAAGILIEVFIGGIAAIVWVNSSPGFIGSISYYLCTVAIISTVLVNGNPFIRFDGYYILSDICRITNLQNQTVLAWNKLFDWIFLGIKLSYSDLYENFGKNYILIYIYGICAFIYKIFLYAGIVLLIYFMFTKAIGIILAVFEIYLLFISPLKNQIKRLNARKKMTNKRYARIPLAVIFILLIIWIIPLPWNESMPCIVQPEKLYSVHMPENGYFLLSADDGAFVEQGSIIAKFNNPDLELTLLSEKFKLTALEAELDQILSDQSTLEMAKIKSMQIEQTQDTIHDLTRKLESLTVKAPFSGFLTLQERSLNKGRWFSKGELIGTLDVPESKIVLAYAEESVVSRIHPGNLAVITLNNVVYKYYATVIQVDNVPVVDWKPSPLLNIFGGKIQVVKVNELNRYLSSSYYYQIVLQSTDRSLPSGRTGTVNIRIYKSLAYSLFKNILSPLQKEITF